MIVALENVIAVDVIARRYLARLMNVEGFRDDLRPFFTVGVHVINWKGYTITRSMVTSDVIPQEIFSIYDSLYTRVPKIRTHASTKMSRQNRENRQARR